MDGTALDQAYTAAKAADSATIAVDYSKAASLHTEASTLFSQAAQESPSNPANRILFALADQHKSRAKYLASGKAKQDVKKMAVANTHSQLASQLSSARNPAALSPQLNMPGGLPSMISGSTSGQTTTSTTPAAIAASSILLGSTEDKMGNVLSTTNQAFSRAYDQALLAARGTDPSESFYLVGAAHHASDQDATNADLGVRLHALETANRAQKQALKKALQALQQQISAQERKLVDEHTEEVDRLRAENDRLRIQVSKLKSRWDDLKESAKKRSGRT